MGEVQAVNFKFPFCFEKTRQFVLLLASSAVHCVGLRVNVFTGLDRSDVHHVESVLLRFALEGSR